MSLPLVFANFALALLCAPLLNGIIKALKARLQNRIGPGLLQPWYDIWKYLGRESVVSEHASWIFRFAPYVYFAAHLAAALLVPTIVLASPLGGLGDVVLVVGLLALGRFALALAALDTASNFGGMGTSRELTFAALVEPALLIAIFALAIPAGSTDLATLAATSDLSVPRLLAFGALFIAAVAETGRIPVDNPDTHLELTMAHEGMLLEYSGRPLGLLLWATHVKQLVVLSLLAALFVPWGAAPWGAAASPTALALAVGVAVYLAKVAILGLALGFVETVNVKMRMFRIPDLLGAAALLGCLAIVAVYVVG